MPNHRRLEIAAHESRIETPFTGIPVVPMPEGARQSPTPERAFADCGSSGLTESQVAEYRHRLARGFYASPAVVRETARRILESGDF